MTEDKGRTESEEPKKENEQTEQQPNDGNPLGANFLSQLEDAIKGLGGQFVRMDVPRGNMGAQADGNKQPPKKDKQNHISLLQYSHLYSALYPLPSLKTGFEDLRK